jgi:heme O synthase-like polyprenyltransferase
MEIQNGDRYSTHTFGTEAASAAAALPWAFGAAGTVYAVVSGLSGVAMIALANRLDRSLYLDARPARRVFAFSILEKKSKLEREIQQL